MPYQLAQLNIARLRQPIDHPDIADFVNGLDQINALAEQSSGFRWRLQSYLRRSDWFEKPAEPHCVL